jgi:hypothetical protein
MATRKKVPKSKKAPLVKASGGQTKYYDQVEPNLHLIAKWAEDGVLEKDMCKALHISTAAFSNYKRTYPTLRLMLNHHKAVHDSVIQAALARRAEGYEYEETKTVTEADGSVKIEVTTKHVKPDVTAATFWLRNRWADKWKLNPEVIIDPKDSDDGGFKDALNGKTKGAWDDENSEDEISPV